MASGAEQEKDSPFDAGELHERDSLDGIKGNLMAEVPDDDRFSSGVPAGQRANSLDFIQMTGLTRAPLRAPAKSSAPQLRQEEVDLNPMAPLSFYEPGVTDVDDSSAGGLLGLADAVLDQQIVPDIGSDTLHDAPKSTSADLFKDIVAGLEGTTRTPVPATPEALPLEERSASADLLALLNAFENENEGAASSESSQSFDDFIEDYEMATPEETGDETPSSAAVDADTDDWDALLDSATSPSGPLSLFEQKVSIPKSPLSSGALAEAEQLMQALGRKKAPAENSVALFSAGDKSVDPVPNTSPQSLLPTYTPTIAPTIAPTSDIDGDLAYDYSANPSRRRSRRHSRATGTGKRFIRGLLVAMVLLGVAAAGYLYLLQPMMDRSEGLPARADRLMSEARYAEASKAYEILATQYKTDPVEGPEALFTAAYALTLGPRQSQDEMSDRYNRAIHLFETFVNDYPAHPKRTRALAIMGRLHYELREYEQAIEILRDKVDPANDPDAAVAIHRNLAFSYSQLAEYEAAESAFLLAATVPGNYGKDEDFYSLGDMYKTRAGLATTEEERQDFLKTTAKYWQRAIQEPGIKPGRKAAIQGQLELLGYRSDQDPTEWGVAEDANLSDSTPNTAPAMVEEMPEVDVAPPVVGNHEVDPGAELDALINMPKQDPTPGEETTEAESAPAMQDTE